MRFDMYESGASTVPPQPPVNPSIGYPTNGDAKSGTQPTVPGAYWFYSLTEELRQMVLAAGIEPSSDENNQVAQALTKFKTAVDEAGKKAMADISQAQPAALEEIKKARTEAVTTIDAMPKSNHYLGELVKSAFPITDAGLHLADGDILAAGGIYDAFISYADKISKSYPKLFITEDEWQTQVEEKGSCGKFVINRDDDGNAISVRLPKVSDILQGTSDPTAVGDFLEAGLPNITGLAQGDLFDLGTTPAPIFWKSEGALHAEIASATQNVAAYKADKTYTNYTNLSFNASKSNSIYGKSTTVQPQTIKALLYICVATTAKTDIEVDIDNIAADLNNKLSKSGGDITGRTTIAATDLIVTATAANGAGVHNSIFRGKYLGSSITEAQSAAIRAGTFDDLYIGDYWIINNVKYVIAAFDYYLHTGDTECTTHHIVVVPEKALYQAQMNGSNTTEGAYVGSAMYKTNLNSAKSTILVAFGSSHLLSIRQYFQNATANNIPTGGIWADATVFLMSEMNVYGCRIYGAIINGTNWPTIYTTDNRQYPYFAMNNLLQTRDDFWLRDVCSAHNFAFVDGAGGAGNGNASRSRGVRPAFCVI